MIVKYFPLISNCQFYHPQLPLSYNPSSIACCQSTGNVLVNHNNIIQIFIFKYCTNEQTKLQYIDFFEAPFQIELDFQPTLLLVNEDIISCCNKQFFHVLKVFESVDCNNSTTSESNVCTSTEMPQSQPASAIINLESDVDFQAIADRAEVNGVSFNVKMKSNQEETMGSFSDDVSEMRPVATVELGAKIKYISTLPDSFSLPSKFSTQNLLQLKLHSIKISGVLRENVDHFKCMFMKPLYVKSSHSGGSKANGLFFMHSKFHQNFYGASVLITTQQDGFMYHVNANSPDFDASKCFMNVYPFTADLKDVFFNENVLHALTVNGIESYTHRIGQKMLEECGSDYNNLSTAISLVNLRPFMNVQYLIPGEENVILLTNDLSSSPQAESSEVNWTIYNLKYPSMATIYNDFKEFADKSLRKYPAMYMNLLEEIHVMIRSHALLGRLEPAENSEYGHEMKLMWDDCAELLKDSSLALADCFIT